MDKTIKILYTKYGEAFRYLVVGGLTTLINIVIFFSLTHIAIPWFWANVVAWFLSVLFAFIANKKVVFGSTDMAPSIVFKEGMSFFALRGASLLADTAILFVGLTLMHGSPIIVKIVDQVVVIGLNYVFSKHIFS